MKHLLKSSVVSLIFLLIFSIATAQDIKRGSPVNAKCGDIIDSEFTSNYEEQNFTILMKASDSLNVSITPFGDQLNTSVRVVGPTNLGIASSGGNNPGPDISQSFVIEKVPKLETGTLSANGEFTIRVVNFGFGGYNNNEDFYYFLRDSGGIGVYTLYIGCILKDGTVINPGDNMPAQSTTGSAIAIPDLSNVAPFPLLSGTAMGAGITATGNEVYTYTIDASANDKLDLTLTRASGNLNLSLLVLSPDNKIVFQTNLVSLESLTTRFTLPTAGTYTIGVFRIDLLPPDNPQPTAFQVQATLNP